MRQAPARIASDELFRRAHTARAMLRHCQLCELRCGIDRTAGQKGPCQLDDQTWCFKRHVSFAEELELLPSYMVYLGGCNFRCRFCVQGPTCFAPRVGTRVEADQAARDFERLVGKGAKTINLLGGEPSLHLHTILEIAAHAAEPLPLVLNSNMYMTPEVIDLLDGVVTLYLADFKFGSDACARSIANVDRYVEVVTRNLLHAHAQAPMLVRHLVMPGHVECCLLPVAEWLATHLPEVPFTLSTGYVPAWRAAKSDDLSRTLTDDEIARAEEIVSRLALRRAA